MKQSLEATARALGAFVESLERSGFKKSIPAYRQMQQVLIQQRLWADRQSRNELLQNWESIARQSDELYQVMKSFAEVMGELRNIDKIKFRSPNDEDKERLVEYKRIQEILCEPQFISAIKLSNLLNMERRELIDKINPLINQNIVEKKGWGNSVSYRFRSHFV